MDKILLIADKIGEEEFELEHAKNIFSLQRNTPPAKWKISPNEKKYKLEMGEFVLKTIEPKSNIVIE